MKPMRFAVAAMLIGAGAGTLLGACELPICPDPVPQQHRLESGIYHSQAMGPEFIASDADAGIPDPGCVPEFRLELTDGRVEQSWTRAGERWQVTYRVTSTEFVPPRL